MANGAEVAKAYVTIIPSMKGAQNTIAKELGAAADSEGTKAGSKIGSALSSGIGTALKVGTAAIGAATTAVGALGAASVKTGMDFDSSMSQVAATMGKNTDEIQNLRDFAMEMGSKTAFSATEAADALNYMALAGYDADTSMKMLPNVLNLAAAGSIDLASASDMVTDAQSALGLSLDETSQMVDKMAMTSSKSNTSVEQLGQAFLTVGGIAKDLSGGTTELSTALGLLADNGIKGSEGGTHLRNILLAMNPTTDAAAAAWKKLGVSGYDASGKLRPLEETFGDLAKAMDGMSDQERSQTISDMFKVTDIASVNALLSTSAERWGELTSSIDQSSFSLDDFRNAAESIGYIPEAVDMSIEELKQFGITQEEFTKALNESGGSSERFCKILAELSDGSATWDEICQHLVGDADEMATAFDYMRENAKGASEQMANTQLDNLAGDVTLFKSALEGAQIVISDQLSPTLRDFVKFGSESVSKLSDAFKEGGLTGAMDAFGTILSDGLNMIIEKLPSFVDAGIQLLESLGQGIINNLPTIIDATLQISTSILNALLENLPEIIQAGLEIITQLAIGIGQALPELIPTIVDVVLNIVDTLIDNVDLLIDGAIALILGLAEGLMNALPRLMEKVPEIIVKLRTALILNAPKLLEAAVKLMITLGEGLIKYVGQFLIAIPKIVLKAKEAFIANKDKFLDAGKNMVLGIKDGIVNAWHEITDWIKNKCRELLDTVKGIFGIHSPSAVFRDQVGKNLALGIGEGYVDEMQDVNKRIESSLQADFNISPTVTAEAMTIDTEGVETNNDDVVYKLDQMIKAITNLRVVLDSGKTVGALISEIDNSLGVLRAREAM